MTDHGEIVRNEKWNINELPSLVGKTAIVTGANRPDGIGYNVAYQLFLKGAKVFVGARSDEKANTAIALMKSSSPSSDSSLLKPLVMDLGNFKDLKRIAEKLVEEEERLDILVNNAALLSRSKASEVDAHGIGQSIGTNHLGPFLFTTTLLPLLVKTAKTNPDVRIVTVSSEAHYFVPPTARFDSLAALNESFQTPLDIPIEGLLAVFGDALDTKGQDNMHAIFIRYGYSKLANVLFVEELQRRLDAQDASILSLSVHPGTVATNSAAELLGRDHALFKASMSPADGALTPLFAGAHPEPRKDVDRYKGGYLVPWGELQKASEAGRNVENAKSLWETSERVLEDVFGA